MPELRQSFMYQLAVSPAEQNRQVKDALRNAGEFRRTAQFAIDNDLTGSAISNLHETARLAITATVARAGFRFRDTKGAHAAVDDYALASGLVNRAEWARLDALRDLRNANNYPADISAPPSAAEVGQFAQLVDDVVKRATDNAAPATKRIPPPPKR